ncbi:MAG: cell division protein FtsH, partial [Eubacteriales bacterium]
RPGRFDRRIPVELPDLAGREAILKVHAKNVKMDPSIDYSVIARATAGASGAELANIVNEAALRAVRMGRSVVWQEDLQESVEVVIAGYQRKNAAISENEKKIIAYHEIGHALVAAMQTGSAPVQKITIIPRTSGALGYTMQVEEGERVLLSREDAIQKITTYTGGRAAEEVVFHSVTSGASNDIEQATKLARAMVTRYGMSERFGMVALETVSNPYLSSDTSLSCAAETAAQIDAEVIAIVGKAHETALGILSDNIDRLHRLSAFLLEKETITGEEFMKLLGEKTA